jgi:hypothetical protein
MYASASSSRRLISTERFSLAVTTKERWFGAELGRVAELGRAGRDGVAPIIIDEKGADCEEALPAELGLLMLFPADIGLQPLWERFGEFAPD